VPFTAIPSLQLPFQLSIITHHAELASKNTGVSTTLRMALFCIYERLLVLGSACVDKLVS
jgi:hypothetical protein